MPQIQFSQGIFPSRNNNMVNAIGIVLKSTFIPYKCCMPSISCQDWPLAYSQFARLFLLAACRRQGVVAKNRLSEDRFCGICSVSMQNINQKASEIWPVQAILQPTIPVSDRLLEFSIRETVSITLSPLLAIKFAVIGNTRQG